MFYKDILFGLNKCGVLQLLVSAVSRGSQGFCTLTLMTDLISITSPAGCESAQIRITK